MAANTPQPVAKKQSPGTGASDPAAPDKRSQKLPDHKLTLDELLGWLQADKLVASDIAEKLLSLRKNFRASNNHPLTLLADQKWQDPRSPKKLLTLEALTEWLA
ncbi:MAG TPA: hypothetical protein VN496_15780, partial [Burkholderiales bacterium]|nr:hypothetical protein [Burkholderiales bacterium]